MCNRYKKDIKLDALRDFDWYGVDWDEASLKSNFEPGDVWADQDAPIIRWCGEDNKYEIAELRWGFPEVSKGKRPITNIRNLGSSWWKNVNGEYMTQSRYRTLVPFQEFAEHYSAEKRDVFFRPTAQPCFFAGVWRPWQGERLMAVEGKKRRQRVTRDDWELFSFLTTEANGVVKPVHEKAMPVILTTPQECSDWMQGIPPQELQRPLPDGLLKRMA